MADATDTTIAPARSPTSAEKDRAELIQIIRSLSPEGLEKAIIAGRVLIAAGPKGRAV